MAYPLIILGAGASYDFQNLVRYQSTNDIFELREWRPPLINNLFDAARFGRIIGNYEDVKPLASVVSNLSESPNFDFEQYLSNKEKNHPDNSLKQIMALRFYLAELFSKISCHFYQHQNNHRHLIDEINNNGGNACIVNFNYDTLFEKNLNSINLNNRIDSYISENIKVIKIHGAYNWTYDPFNDPFKEDVYEYFNSNVSSVNQKYKKKNIYPIVMKDFDYKKNYDFNIHEYRKPNEEGWLYYLPALAIPVASKDNHVYPKSHINTLVEQLAVIDRILVIGWSAQDNYLFTLLEKHLKGNIKLTIVTGGSPSVDKIVSRFTDASKIDPRKIMVSNKGYTSFMINGECEKFFEQ